jgi:hypothetical protein
MADTQAQPAEAEKAKSPEEIKKDEAATELLKELEAEDAGESGEGGKGKEPEDNNGADAGSEADGSESQSENKAAPKKKGFERRVSRLVRQREDAKGEAGELAQKLSASEEEKKLLRMRIEQLANAKEQEITEPDPDSFDGGDIDPEYVKARREFDQATFRKIAREEAAGIAKEQDQNEAQRKAAGDLKRKQEEHWKNADALGAADYDAAEEKAIEVIGPDMVNNIIKFFPGRSHKALYYLGLENNAEEAEQLAEMFNAGDNGLVAGVAEVGAILERIKNKPLKPTINPDPDEETEGSASSPQEALQAKLDALREDAAKSGRSDRMKKILAFKKKARDRGITLR